MYALRLKRVRRSSVVAQSGGKLRESLLAEEATPKSEKLGVGIIGASAARGCAKDSHVPAIQSLQCLHLTAVAAGNVQKAEEAKRAFGTEKGYASGFDLIQDPRVDIVTVAVKVPDHRELVLAAVAAGKHIYCEWPLGSNVVEADEMAKAASEACVHTAIGLQMRSSGAVRRSLSRDAGCSG